MTTLTSIALVAAFARRRLLFLAPPVRFATNAMFLVACAQASLGIATLVYFVPIPLAATHQAGSLTLYSVSLWLMHLLKRLPK
jgi:cytochrome c oxidase assembly protein subunit 15